MLELRNESASVHVAEVVLKRNIHFGNQMKADTHSVYSQLFMDSFFKFFCWLYKL